MLIEVKVPQLSESVAEATLLNWHKKPGEFVQRDENLVDIETDKVVLETPAPDSGLIVKVVKGDGSTVVSNEVIAQIDTEAKPAAAAPATAAQAEAKTRTATASQPAAAVMPAAQKLAAEKNMDPAAIPGTGRGGRVTKEDVQHAVEGGAQPPSKPAATPTTPPAPQRTEAPAGPRPGEAPAGPRPAGPRPGAPAPSVDLGALGERGCSRRSGHLRARRVWRGAKARSIRYCNRHLGNACRSTGAPPPFDVSVL